MVRAVFLSSVATEFPGRSLPPYITVFSFGVYPHFSVPCEIWTHLWDAIENYFLSLWMVDL